MKYNRIPRSCRSFWYSIEGFNIFFRNHSSVFSESSFLPLGQNITGERACFVFLSLLFQHDFLNAYLYSPPMLRSTLCSDFCAFNQHLLRQIWNIVYHGVYFANVRTQFHFSILRFIYFLALQQCFTFSDMRYFNVEICVSIGCTPNS